MYWKTHTTIQTNLQYKDHQGRRRRRRRRNDDDDIIEITDVKEKKSFANLKDEVRISTFKAFYNFFKKVIPKDGDNTTEEAIESRVNDMALEIESIIHENFSGKAYPTEARRILFVLKKHFMQEIFDRTITFKDVVHKTPQEINADIAKIENKIKTSKTLFLQKMIIHRLYEEHTRGNY